MLIQTHLIDVVSLELKWYPVETASLAGFYWTSVKLFIREGVLMYYYSNTKIKVNMCTNFVLGRLKKKRKKKEKMENLGF